MNYKIKDVKLFQFGVKNTNHRIYTEKEVTFKPDGIVTSIPDNVSVIGGFSNARVEGDYLVCDVTLTNDSFKNLAKNDLIEFTTSGVGELDKDGVTVLNFELKSVFVVPKGSKA